MWPQKKQLLQKNKDLAQNTGTPYEPNYKDDF